MTAVDASKRFLKWKQWKYQRVFCHIPLSSVTQLRAMIHSLQKNDTKKKRETGKTESTNLKERSLSKIGQLKAAFCILCRIDLPSAMKIDYEKGRRRKNGLLRIRKSQNTRGGSRIINLFAFCCNQTVSIDASLCIPLVILASFSIFK